MFGHHQLPSYLGLPQKVAPELAANLDKFITNIVIAIQASEVFLSLALI